MINIDHKGHVFKKFSICLMVCCPLLILFREFGFYHMNSLWWSDLECEETNCNKILVVASPRLFVDEDHFQLYDIMTRRDNDWYLQNICI